MARKRISTEIANKFDKIIDRLTHVDISYSHVDEAIEKTRAFLEKAGVLDGNQRVDEIINDKKFLRRRAAEVRKEAGEIPEAERKRMARDPFIAGPEGLPMQGSKREVVDFFRLALGDEICDELLETPVSGIRQRVRDILEERSPAHIDQSRYLAQFDVKFDKTNVARTDKLIAEIKRTR